VADAGELVRSPVKGNTMYIGGGLLLLIIIIILIILVF
jgi:hypothetical protein